MFWDNDHLTEQGRNELILAMKLTASDQAEPEHFLLAMFADERSPLVRGCRRLHPSVNIASLKETLSVTSRRRDGRTLSTGDWSDRMLSERTRTMMRQLVTSEPWLAARTGDRECLLAAAVLETVISRVRHVIDRFGVDVAQLIDSLRRTRDQRPGKPNVFDDQGKVLAEAFTHSGRAVLRLVESEGKGLGLTRISSLLWLFAHLTRDDGLLHRALRLQAINPTEVHETLLLHLRSLSKKRFNEDLQLRRESMQPLVVAALEQAAQLAYEMELPQVGEAELLKGLLLQNDYAVTSFLDTVKVDVAALSDYIRARHSGEEEPEEEDHGLPTTEEIEARLRKNVIGQGHAIDMVMPLVKRMRFGYTRRNRPMAVMLFLGNSGTGKTQLAKELARAMYGSEENLVFLEMGQFGDEHSRNTFIGAPPGYVGYGQGLLTNGLRDKPESVVLFDEVEKAHPLVFDVLLRFLDEGQIADPAGPVRDGRRCIIILTSNHALDRLQSLIDGQSAAKNMTPKDRELARSELRRTILETKLFRPEFLNRVDELLLFNTFDAGDYRKILENQLEEEQRRLREEKDLDVEFDELLVDEMVRRCVERSDEGARVCAKLIGDLIITAVIDFCLEPENKGIRSLSVRYEPEIGVQVAPRSAGAPSP